MRALPLTITLVASLLLYRSADAPATPGFAEWEITTPGGHLISHIDPLKSRYGTCLRKPDATPGLVYDRPEDVYVAHIEWWAYHRDHVSGKARSGYFLFDEGRRGVSTFPTEALLDAEIQRRGLGPPVSARLTPEDGWREVWHPLLRERCRQFATGSPDMAPVDEPTRRRIADLCRALGP